MESKHSAATMLQTGRCSAAHLRSLQGLWPKLRRLDVDQGLKQRVLVAVFWPKAFHGVAVCLLAKGHV